MCTLTYLPKGSGLYILTSNRDEAPGREAGSIETTTPAGKTVAFPKDAQAGGTWIATSNGDRTANLLNGAFGRHERRPPYKRSRGLMVLDFFDFPDAMAFFQNYDLPGMEPFTLVVLEKGRLFEFRWDGRDRYLFTPDPEKPRLWSSPMLYEAPVRARRQAWFKDWLKGRRDFSREAILDFHRHAGEGDPWSDVVMNRDGMVQTVSITQIEKMPENTYMQYYDLLRDQQEEYLLDQVS